MAFLLAFGAVLGLATVAAESLKFPCLGASYTVVAGERRELEGANVNCASGECQLEKGSLDPEEVAPYQNAIFLNITTTTQPYTIKKGRYAFFVNCSNMPVRFNVQGVTPANYFTVANNKSKFIDLTEVNQDYTFLFSATPPS